MVLRFHQLRPYLQGVQMLKKRFVLFLLMALTVLSFSIICHADSNKPKNFRILYVSEDGRELEHIDYKVYQVQQIFLDKLALKSYIDPEGYEYNPTGYRVKTWSERDFKGSESEDVPMGYYGVVDELNKIYSNQEPPWSIQASIVLHANGGKYPTSNLVRVLWLNQDSELIREEQYTIGREESYTDEVPSGYEIISVKAFMMDIWKINNETTIDPAHPTVTYDKFAEEYSIVYRMNLTPEQEAEIKGQEETTEAESASGQPESSESTESTSASEPQSSESPAESSSVRDETTKAYPVTEADKESEIMPSTKADESYSGSNNRVTLILGCVIAVVVIYLVIISIGINSKKRKKNKKKDYRL